MAKRKLGLTETSIGGTDQMGKLTRKLIFSGETARVLGVSGERVRQMVQEGKLKPVRVIGGVRVFDAAQVERLRCQRELRAKGEAKLKELTERELVRESAAAGVSWTLRAEVVRRAVESGRLQVAEQERFGDITIRYFRLDDLRALARGLEAADAAYREATNRPPAEERGFEAAARAIGGMRPDQLERICSPEMGCLIRFRREPSTGEIIFAAEAIRLAREHRAELLRKLQIALARHQVAHYAEDN